MRKVRIKWKNLFLLIILVTSFIFLFISVLNIVRWKLDSNKTEKQVIEIHKIENIKEVLDNEKTEIIEQKEEIKKSDPYWDYLNMNLIDVDLNKIKDKNSDTVGWITVGGTSINYPFVQTTNNDYYLKKSFDKSYNTGGWIFLDYRNNLENLNKNTIIYGHGRADKTMFGTLKNILHNGWLDNSDNFVVRLSTVYENTLWQVFSVYEIPTTSDYLHIDFVNDDEYMNFLNLIKDRSAYNFNTSVSVDDNIVTLSTCYNKKVKLVLHAKLIKKEVKAISE